MWRSLLLVVAIGCNTTPPCYPSNYPNYTAYQVTVTHDTAGGIHLDDPTHQLDPDRVDRTVQRVQECLASLNTVPLSNEEFAQAECYGSVALETRSCFVVKLAPDWHVSQCSTEELFPCSVPDVSCTEKGLTPTPECPCQCRAMVQDNTVLITTPNMRLFPAYLTTLLTGCNRPWTTRLAPCSSPDLAR